MTRIDTLSALQFLLVVLIFIAIVFLFQCLWSYDLTAL